MKDIILISTVITIFIFGYFMMEKLDHLLDEAIKNGKEEKAVRIRSETEVFCLRDVGTDHADGWKSSRKCRKKQKSSSTSVSVFPLT